MSSVVNAEPSGLRNIGVVKPSPSGVGRGLDALFTGPVADLSKRWGASAVVDMAGNWYIVRLEGHIQDDQPRRVKLFTGGAFGRGQIVDQAWFEANAVRIFFGVMTLARGQGEAAVHSYEGKPATVELDEISTSPPDGVWMVTLVSDDLSTEMPLAEALRKVNAPAVDVS